MSAYSYLLCEDFVEPACLFGDRSLFLSYGHLEGHFHYYNRGAIHCLVYISILLNVNICVESDLHIVLANITT